MLKWRDWRNNLQTLPEDEIYKTIAYWWKMVPMAGNTIDVWREDTWPTPWELIIFNSFCSPARGLGMYYTLTLLEIQSELILAKIEDDTTLLVRTAQEKLLNYYEGDACYVSESQYDLIRIYQPTDVYTVDKV
jgi:hypothetical protein